jgi:hypothetical protein
VATVFRAEHSGSAGTNLISGYTPEVGTAYTGLGYWEPELDGSGNARNPSGGFYRYAQAPGTFSASHTITASAAGVTGGANTMQLHFCSDGTNYYALDWLSGTTGIQLSRVGAGAASLATYGTGYTSGGFSSHVIVVDIVAGTSVRIRVYKDGGTTAIIDYTDTSGNRHESGFIAWFWIGEGGLATRLEISNTADVPGAGGLTLSPTGVSATGAVGTPTRTFSPRLLPTGVSATGAVGTPIFRTNVSLSPTGVGATGAVGTVTLTLTSRLNPTGVSATGAVGTPIFRSDVSLSPTGVSVTGAVGTPTISTGGGTLTLNPTGVSATGAVGTPSFVASVALTPTGVSATGAVGTVTLTLTSRLNPTGVSATGAVGTPAFGGGVVLSPTGVGATGAVGTVTLALTSRLNPTGVSATGAVGTPTFAAGSLLTLTPTGVGATGAVSAPGTAVTSVLRPVGVVGVGAVSLPGFGGAPTTVVRVGRGTQSIVLPQPPEQYDMRDQIELRRLTAQTIERLQNEIESLKARVTLLGG